MQLYREEFECLERDEKEIARVFAEYISMTLPEIKTAIDIGCGPGLFVRCLISRGIQTVGVDIDPRVQGQENLVCGDIFDLDFSRYDLAICLEVAEHVEESCSERFIDKVCSASDTIIFSAAHPGQGGVFHINCQPKQNWVNRFLVRGFTVEHLKTEQMISYVLSHRQDLTNLPDGWDNDWFSKNAMFLTRSSHD